MSNDNFSVAYEKLHALPQVVQTIHVEWGQCLFNTLNGMVVSLETKKDVFMGKKTLTGTGLRVSAPSHTIYGGTAWSTMSVVLDTNEAINKLVAAWEKQAI